MFGFDTAVYRFILGLHAVGMFYPSNYGNNEACTSDAAKVDVTDGAPPH